MLAWGFQMHHALLGDVCLIEHFYWLYCHNAHHVPIITAHQEVVCPGDTSLLPNQHRWHFFDLAAKKCQEVVDPRELVALSKYKTFVAVWLLA
jgi:hypothetical protein